jgi:uncharacterized protein (DUF433 family)
MNTKIGMLTILAMFAAGASADESGECRSTLTITDVAHAMGAGVAAQPVFAGDRVKDWRIYGMRKSTQLTAQEINDGALMTHVCGMPANEIYTRGGEICCKVDTSSEIEATFKTADGDMRVRIRRAEPVR